MKILLLSAVPEELLPLKQTLNISIRDISRIGGINVQKHAYAKHELFLACTGVGTSYAGLCMGTLALALKPDLVIFIGTAGGVDSTLSIGDIVIANEAIDVDIFNLRNEIMGTPFEASLINPNNQQPIPRGYLPKKLPILSKLPKLPQFKNLHRGILGSTNFFPAPDFIYETIKNLNILALDMESSAIYQAGAQLDIDTIVIRAISNLINHEGKDPDIAQSNPDLAGNNLAEFTIALLQTLTAT